MSLLKFAEIPDEYAERSFLVTYFRDFYAEIIRQKQRALLGLRIVREDEPLEDVAIQVLVDQIASKLMAILKSQSEEAVRQGGEFALTIYQEAQYAMVALADEIFLNMDWIGRSFWEQNILESRVYNTHNAGELVFHRMDTFLVSRDRSRSDLAAVYLMVLGLGFKGKFRDEDTGDLTAYRHQLFAFITHHPPRLYSEQIVIFPDAYRRTLESGEIKMMMDPRLWYISILSFLALYLVVTTGIWVAQTFDLSKTVSNIAKIGDGQE